MGSADALERSCGSTLSERRQAQAAARHEQYTQKQAQFIERTKEQQRRAAAEEEARFMQQLQEVAAAVQQRSGVLGEVDALLQHQEQLGSAKAQQLHQQWEDEVFQRIQGRLQRQLEGRSPREISARLRAASDAYIAACGRKLGVFRDVVIEGDYDPLAPRAAAIRVPTGDLRDPLRGDLLRDELELRQLGMSRSAPTTPGRCVLEPVHWGAAQILATPFGHCVAADGSYQVRPASKAQATNAASHVQLDDYGAAASEPDFAVRGRRPSPLRGLKSRVDDILHARPVAAGERVAGDVWLEARFKRSLPGPDSRQGRHGLFEILQQGSNPYQDGRSLGDAWLESAKGKRPVPGPEVRRGRANLFDVLQMRPLLDGATTGQQLTGDAWLDAKGRRTSKPLAGGSMSART